METSAFLKDNTTLSGWRVAAMLRESVVLSLTLSLSHLTGYPQSDILV